MSMLKISIITINRNNAEGLRRTLDSVKGQTCQEFEHIIIDGASTDDSVRTIEEYVRDVSCLKYEVLWKSEPDTGIYNAMNKGLKMAHGEYALMLNSGDFLVDEHVIERIMPELHDEDIIQGNVIEDYPDKTIRYRGYGDTQISFEDVLEANFPHQAMFVKLNTMERYGYYDEQYKKASDSYFFITALGFGNATFRYVDIDVANFDVKGISSMQDPKWRQIDQEEDARWFGEHVSIRLRSQCEDYKNITRLYNNLHRHSWIWLITKALARISEALSPTPPKVKIERIK